jgi:hypothetical protein
VKIQGVKVTPPSDSLFPESTRFFIESIRAMLASALAAVSSLQVVRLSEYDKAFLREVVVHPLKSLLAALI